MSAGVISKESLISKIWMKLNNYSYYRAAKLICVGKLMAEKISGSFNTKKGTKVIVIPDWADTEYLIPIEKKDNPFLKEYSLLDTIIIMYSGNIGITHDISMLINLAELLKDDHHFQFVIIGDGPNKENLRNESFKRRLKNILFLPYQTRENFKYSIAAADISVVSLSKKAEKNMMPCKTYSGMAVGSVIFGISHPPNDVEYIIDKYNCGFNILPNDINSALKILYALFENPELFIEYKRNSRKNAEKYFSSYVNTNRIIDIIIKETNKEYYNNEFEKSI